MNQILIKYANIVLGTLLIIGFIVIFYDFSRPIPDPITIIEKNIDNQIDTESENETLDIVVEGEINNPGTYQLAVGSSIIDVINHAGGFTGNADINNINIDLASTISDNLNLKIPSITENNFSTENILIDDNSKNKININQAGIEDLVNLESIGPVTAQKIIDYRIINPYKNIEEIKEVKGIGDKTFEKIKDDITV